MERLGIKVAGLSFAVLGIAAASLADPPIQLSEPVYLTANADGPNSFGFAVSLGSTIAVVGAPVRDYTNERPTGAAFVFRRLGSGWSIDATLEAPKSKEPTFFGLSVGTDDSHIIVGNPHTNGRDGSAEIFRNEQGRWLHRATLRPANSAAAGFGTSVAIRGNLAIVGAPGFRDEKGDSGAVAVYQYDGTNWNELALLTSSEQSAKDRFGASVLICLNQIIVGSPGALNSRNEEAGAVHVFSMEHDNTITLRQTIRSEEISPRGQFGQSISHSADFLAIGAPSAGVANRGSVFVYRVLHGQFVQKGQIAAPDQAAGFGQAVATDGTLVVIGAPREREGQQLSGATYIYDCREKALGFVKRIVPIGNPNHGCCGYSIALFANSLLIGCPGIGVPEVDKATGQVMSIDCSKARTDSRIHDATSE